MSDIHTVVKNDTLSKISRTYGVPVSELKNINHLPNQNKLGIGQQIRLKKEDVLGFQALFLDKDRNPIKGQAYQFEFAGKIIKGITVLDGLTKKIMTVSPQDEVRILIERLDKSIKEVATVASGYGNKLVTLVSPSIKLEARTERHPDLKPGELPNKKEKVVPIHHPKAKQPPTTSKKDMGPKATPTKTSDGKPLTKVEGDIPGLIFLGGYTGEQITEIDYEAAAKELGCEAEVIKAIAKQETGKLEALGLGGFDKFSRPTILYERHIFSRVTKGVYDAKYPDLSSSKEYLAGTARNKDGEKFDDGAHYGLFSWQYKKLSKAYQLDKEASIQACSWGKFQVLGANYKICGFSLAVDFAKAMCKSEKEHLNIMVLFCKGNKLEPALKNKDWPAIAKTYNGPKYKKNKYDTELEAHYNLFKKTAKK
jgi:LysM repeat protein